MLAISILMSAHAQRRQKHDIAPVLLLRVKSSIFLCASHEQLSVRESTTAALNNFFPLVDPATTICTFQEIVAKANQPNAKAAAHAEGWLGLCVVALQAIPVSFLLKHWEVVDNLLQSNLQHAASTVRIKASSLVESICKHSSLQGTSSEHEQILQRLLTMLSTPYGPGHAWEYAEGICLATDVVLDAWGGVFYLHSADPRFVRAVEKRHFAASEPTGGLLFNLPTGLEETHYLIAPRDTIVIEEVSPWTCVPKEFTVQLLHQALSVWLESVQVCFESTQFEVCGTEPVWQRAMCTG